MLKHTVGFACLLVLVVPALASADTIVNFRQPLFVDGTNTCVMPAEEFIGSGFLHIQAHLTVATDGSLHEGFELNVESAQAVGVLPPFKKYVETAESGFTSNSASDLVPREETREEHVSYIRQGEDGTYLVGDDLYHHVLVHMTVNANGDITVDKVVMDFECR